MIKNTEYSVLHLFTYLVIGLVSYMYIVSHTIMHNKDLLICQIQYLQLVQRLISFLTAKHFKAQNYHCQYCPEEQGDKGALKVLQSERLRLPLRPFYLPGALALRFLEFGHNQSAPETHQPGL